MQSSGGRGNGGRSSAGRSSTGGRGRNNNDRGSSNSNYNSNQSGAKRNDEWKVVGKNGKQVAVHPAYQFDRDEWFNLPDQVRAQLSTMRKEYKAKKMRTMSQADSFAYPSTHGNYDSFMVPPPPPPAHINVPPSLQNDGSNRFINQAARGQEYNNRSQQSNGNHFLHISSVTMGTQFQVPQGGVMGGCNEQASFRGRNQNNRNIHNVISRRKVGNVSRVPEPKPNTHAFNEADTNADTCCLGKNFVPISYTNCSADVYPYHDAYEPLENVPIVSGATAFDHADGNTYILIINEALYYGEKMGHSLINPNQIRYNGLDFYDNPMRDDELCFDAGDGVKIPLRFRGTKCIFPSQTPTKKELDECIHFHITSNAEWDPNHIDLNKCQISSLAMKAKRHVFEIKTGKRDISFLPHMPGVEPIQAYLDPTSDEAVLSEITPSLVQLKELCVKKLQAVSHLNEVFPARRTFVTKERQTQLTAESLSELWSIGPKRAYATLKATTQNGI